MFTYCFCFDFFPSTIATTHCNTYKPSKNIYHLQNITILCQIFTFLHHSNGGFFRLFYESQFIVYSLGCKWNCSGNSIPYTSPKHSFQTQIQKRVEYQCNHEITQFIPRIVDCSKNRATFHEHDWEKIIKELDASWPMVLK